MWAAAPIGQHSQRPEGLARVSTNKLVRAARLLIENGANPDRINNNDESTRSLAPIVIQSLQQEQAQRLREHQCLQAVFKGLIPESGAVLAAASCLLTDWEISHMAAQDPLSAEDTTDLETIGEVNAKPMSAAEA